MNAAFPFSVVAKSLLNASARRISSAGSLALSGLNCFSRAIRKNKL